MSSSPSGRSLQRSERASLPLPVIDIGALLGPNFRRQNSNVSSLYEDRNRGENEGETSSQNPEVKGANVGMQESDKHTAGESTPSDSTPSMGKTDKNSLMPSGADEATATQPLNHSMHQESLELDSSQDEMTLEELKCLVNRPSSSGNAQPAAPSSHGLSKRKGPVESDGDSSEDDVTRVQSKRRTRGPKARASKKARLSSGARTNCTSSPRKTLANPASNSVTPEKDSVEQSKVPKSEVARSHRNWDQRVATKASDIALCTRNRCVPVTIDHSEVSSLADDGNDTIAMPELCEIVNFTNQDMIETADTAKMACVMCGHWRPIVEVRNNGATPYIHSKANVKGCVCSSCEAAAWLSMEGNIRFKFCTICKRPHPLGSFAPKILVYRENQQGLLSLCLGCRESMDVYRRRRREKIAATIANKKANSSKATSDGASEKSSQTAAAPAVARRGGSDETKPKPPTRRRKRKRAVDNRVATVPRDIAPSTMNRCVPLVGFPLDALRDDEVAVPEFTELVNFEKQPTVETDDGDKKKTCVMCGNLRTVLEKRSDGATPFILSEIRSVCSSCEVTTWMFVESNSVHIKYCTQCREFCSVGCFVPRRSTKMQGLLTSCSRCRSRVVDYRNRRNKAKRSESATNDSSDDTNESNGKDFPTVPV